MPANEFALTENRPDEEAEYRAQTRLWLRLLACTTLIEAELRRRFREEFDFTMPRFDVLAQLDREPSGLVLGELPKRLMVSAGNLTPIVDRLVEDGYITRTPSESRSPGADHLHDDRGQKGVPPHGEAAWRMARFALGGVSAGPCQRLDRPTRRAEGLRKGRAAKDVSSRARPHPRAIAR